MAQPQPPSFPSTSCDASVLLPLLHCCVVVEGRFGGGGGDYCDRCYPPYPWHGYGFLPGRVRVALGNPRVTRDNH